MCSFVIINIVVVFDKNYANYKVLIMNKFLGLFLTILWPLATFSQFTLDGKIVDSQNIENLEVFLSYGKNLEKKLQAEIVNDKFYISGEIPGYRSSILTVKNAGDKRGVKLLLDNYSTYKLSVLLKDDRNTFGKEWYKIETDSKFHNTWRNFYDVQAELSSNIREAKIAYEKGDISKTALDQKVLKLQKEKNKKFKDLAKERPKNFSVPYILTGAPDLSEEYLIYFQMLDKTVQESFWGQKLEEILSRLEDQSGKEVNPKVLLGSLLSKINGKTLGGDKKTFSKENLDSELTLIDFWASWCVPCRKENVHLGKLNNEYSNSQLKIISFSLDTKMGNWSKASSKDNINWENISDLKGVKSENMKNFQINELPRNVLINKEGKIIAVNKFGDELKEFLSQFLSSS